ncbi:T9SS type A sorting domain-containing protein [Rasiella sp. SM2506]|uniref:T9SS type A sorting domain-containing protein n=1 Tax=Rasiella sp. SM2506 TaxID=3423914 RepID=UPI003D7AB9C6
MKHLLLLPTTLFFTAISVAQLYVAPNTSATPSDSYIYVNDEVLFVENDVNLTVNSNDPTTEASIYLRNGSQLIQGESNGANSGSGYISIYRANPGSDAWDYTFYGSPVGDNITVPLATAGNINAGIRSIFTPMYDPLALDYSAPTSLTDALPTGTTAGREGNFDTATNALSISTRWTYAKLASGAGVTYTRIYANNAVPPGRGFIMKGVNRDGATSTHDFVYDFRGRPNNGDFTLPTIPVPALSTDTEQVLTGNPYPSALDLNRLFYDTRRGDPDGTDTFENSEINAFLYWDEDRTIDSHLYIDNKGGFDIWIPGTSNPDGTTSGLSAGAPFLNYNSDGTPAGGQMGTGAQYKRRFAPVGQGFLLQTENSSTSPVVDPSLNSITIKNQYRRNIAESFATNSEFRTANNAVPRPGDSDVVSKDKRLPQIRIYTYFGETHFRDMVLAFHDTSTHFYDRGMDARHPMDASFAEAYFPVKMNNRKDNNSIGEFVIQTVPWGIENKIPYAIKLDRQTEVIVQVVEAVKVTNPVLLFDSVLDTYTQINGNSTATLNLPAGDYKNRFFIVFKSSANDAISANTVVEERRVLMNEILGNVNFFQNNKEAQLEIMNPEAYTLKYAHIFDMTGKLVTTKTDLGNNTKYSISTATMADGVYLVKLVTSDNVSIDYKAIVTNK